MKTVFNSIPDVIHAYFQFDQAIGRAGNVYFENNTLYSYGNHFQLAKLQGDTLFINTQSYSVSTSKHQIITRSAVNKHKVNRVITLDFGGGRLDFQACKEYHIRNAARLFDSWDKAGRKGFLKLVEAEYHLKQLSILVTNGLIDTAGNLPFDVHLIADVLKKANENRVKKALEKDAKALVKSRENLEKWLNGENIGGLHNLPVHLRVKENRIETTKGAQVLLKYALVLLSEVRSGKDVTGQKIGAYQVNRVTLDFIEIGCHKIGFNVINQFFK
jgi:hypothetical protein